jgi:hypothetical protein
MDSETGFLEGNNSNQGKSTLLVAAEQGHLATAALAAEQGHPTTAATWIRWWAMWLRKACEERMNQRRDCRIGRTCGLLFVASSSSTSWTMEATNQKKIPNRADGLRKKRGTSGRARETNAAAKNCLGFCLDFEEKCFRGERNKEKMCRVTRGSGSWAKMELGGGVVAGPAK